MFLSLHKVEKWKIDAHKLLNRHHTEEGKLQTLDCSQTFFGLPLFNYCNDNGKDIIEENRIKNIYISQRSKN